MVLLSRGYKGHPAGAIVQLATQEENALIAQGLATASVGPVTPGNVTTSLISGRVGIAAAGTAVTVNNPAFNAESKFVVNLSNAAADATALYVTRVTPFAGGVTFTLNAASTGVVAIDWALLSISGNLPPN